MTFCYLAVDCFLDPIYWVYYLVSPFFFHHIDCPLKFSIDNPDKKKTFFLQHGHRYLFNSLVAKTAILDSNSSWWLRTWQSPRRIHHDNIKLSLSNLFLFFDETLEVKLGDICTYRYCIISHKWFRFYNIDIFYLKSVLALWSIMPCNPWSFAWPTST